MTAPKEAPETFDQIVAEMRADGDVPPADPRDSHIQNIIRPWRKAMLDRATRLTSARDRERAEQRAKIEGIAGAILLANPNSPLHGIWAKRLREIVEVEK